MPDLGLDKLGPFPLLQLAAALAVLAGVVFAVYRGTRDRRLSADQEYPPPSGFRWYFDGPLNAALESLHEQYKVLCSIDNEVEKFGEEFRIQTRLLGEIKLVLSEIKEQGVRRR